MDIQQLSSGISQHQNSINHCQSQINRLEDEIEELIYLRKRIQNYEMDFYAIESSRKQHKDNAIGYLRISKRYSAKIIIGVENDMQNVLTGTASNHAGNSVAQAIEKVTSEIERKMTVRDEFNEKIVDYRNQIQTLQNQIQTLQNQIQQTKGKEKNDGYNNR